MGAPTVLLIEHNPDLRALEALILADAGLDVATPPAGVSVVDHARQRPPDVIVIRVDPVAGVGLDQVDRLQADPATRTIPVVAIADREPVAARAQAGANVDVAIVAPYDITALQGAVHTALRRPPPAATLPGGSRPRPAAIAAATTALVRESRELVVRAVESLRQVEPYRSRFTELSVGLVDELGTLLGAIATGLQRGLAPSEVVAAPEVRRVIDEHARLRQRQGLPITALIRESQALKQQINGFLASPEGGSGLPPPEGGALARDIAAYFDALTQDLVTRHRPGNGPPLL